MCLCLECEKERERDSSKSLSNNNSDWQWAVLPRRDEACEDRWMAFFADTTKVVNQKTRGPYGTQGIKELLPEFSQSKI